METDSERAPGNLPIEIQDDPPGKLPRWLTIRCRIPVTVLSPDTGPAIVTQVRPCGYWKRYKVLPDQMDVRGLTAADINKLAQESVAKKMVNFFESHTENQHREESKVLREQVTHITEYVILKHIKPLIQMEKT